MTENNDKKNAAVLQAINKAIEQGPWDKTNFLKAIGKSLVAIRDDFLNNLSASSHAQMRSDAQLANKLALRSNQQEVFISLYSSDGINIQSWERIVVNLPNQTISRPIYAVVDDLKEMLKFKDNKMNEAYVAIYVNKSEILDLPPEKVPMDRLGKSLLTLKDKALSLDNLTHFVHASGTYHYSKGRLIRQP